MAGEEGGRGETREFIRVSQITDCAKRIIAKWDDWEAEAGQRAQSSQDADTFDFEMELKVTSELCRLIEDAALVCEGRAKCGQNQISIYNEAMKCADQIRHNMAVD